jgi:hypothetical protein
LSAATGSCQKRLDNCVLLCCFSGGIIFGMAALPVCVVHKYSGHLPENQGGKSIQPPGPAMVPGAFLSFVYAQSYFFS